ncbi:MAG: DUF4252 domain-containing protein [Bacteroidales bacterium]
MIRPVRYLTAALFLLTIAVSCTSEPKKSFEDEVRHLYQDERGFFYIKIPPALLTLGLKMTEDQEMIDFFGDASQVGILSFGEGIEGVENPALVKILEDMLSRYDYEDLIRIADQDRIVSIKIKESSSKISDMVTIVSETQGQVMAITLSGEINIETVLEMAADFDYDMLMNMHAMGRR